MHVLLSLKRKMFSFVIYNLKKKFGLRGHLTHGFKGFYILVHMYRQFYIHVMEN